MLKKKNGGKGKAHVKGAGKPLRWSNSPAAARTFAAGPAREGPGRDGGNAPEFLGARADKGFSPAALRQSLLIFYRTFAPDKEAESEGSLDDLLEVLLYYTSQRGMDALKAKLQAKYGKSLDDVAPPDEVDDDEVGPGPPSEEDEPPPPVLSGHFEPVDARPASGRTLPRTLSGASWNDLSDDMPPPPLYTPTSKGESESRKSIPRGSDARKSAPRGTDARNSNPRGSRRLLSLITGASTAAAPPPPPADAAPAAQTASAEKPATEKRKSRMKSIFSRKPLNL